MTLQPHIPKPLDEVTPPQISGDEEAKVVSTDLTYDPADPSTFRHVVIEDIKNPVPPPGPDDIQVARATRVRMTMPDPRSPKKLVTLKATAYLRDQPDLHTLARAIVRTAEELAQRDRDAA